MKTCPMCGHELVPGPDAKLDQSCRTYLPASTWSCSACLSTVTLATGEPFRAYAVTRAGATS
jgi:transposase-like protein